MKTEKLRPFSDEELRKKREEAHEQLFNLRFRSATKQLANHREIPEVKKTIARIETILRERELGIR